MTSNDNQGEGNVEAARRYDEAQKKFVDSGKVDAAAKAAKPGSDAEAADMARAEEAGRSKAKGDDPAIPGASGSEDLKDA